MIKICGTFNKFKHSAKTENLNKSYWHINELHSDVVI